MLPFDWWAASFCLIVLSLTLHSSLTHEILHGRPRGAPWLGTLIGLFQPGLFVPYLRFRAQHLAHHQDARLTDPYDDPESNYLDPGRWERLPRWFQLVLHANNTLLGRMSIGPLLGTISFVQGDVRSILSGDGRVAAHWLAHVPGVLATFWLVSVSAMPVWLYLLACYAALSVLRIRTFLEHQAHERASGRSVIIEDRGLLAWLFLNNNLHLVHHMHPHLPWYKLPSFYAAHKDRFLRANQGYVYRSYRQIFQQFLLHRKDPVAHPLWRRDAE